MKIIFCQDEQSARNTINKALQEIPTVDCDIRINYNPKHINISNIKDASQFSENHYFFELRVLNIKKNLLNKSDLFEGNNDIFFVFPVEKK